TSAPSSPEHVKPGTARHRAPIGCHDSAPITSSWSRSSSRLLLVVVDLGVLGVDHIILLGATRLAARRRPAGAFLLRLVHRLAELHGRLQQRIGLRLDGFRIVALESLLEVREPVLDGTAIALADLRTVLGQRLLGLVDRGLALVLGFDRGLALLVL